MERRGFGRRGWHVLLAIHGRPELYLLIILPVDASAYCMSTRLAPPPCRPPIPLNEHTVWRCEKLAPGKSLQDRIGGEVVVRMVMCDEDRFDWQWGLALRPLDDGLCVWDQKWGIDDGSRFGADYERRHARETLHRRRVDMGCETHFQLARILSQQ